MATDFRFGAALMKLDPAWIVVITQLVFVAAMFQGLRPSPLGWLVAAGYAGVGGIILLLALRRSKRQRFAIADRITLVRATFVGAVATLVADSFVQNVSIVVLVVLAILALALDAVDGSVARRTGTASAFGARFDMEVDAFLILVLSVFVAKSVGGWVLAIGAMRYVFGVAGSVVPWLRSPLPPSLARKTVAALQGIVLVAASSGVLPQTFAVAAVALALALLVWSFGRDALWLWRERHSHA